MLLHMNSERGYKESEDKALGWHFSENVVINKSVFDAEKFASERNETELRKISTRARACNWFKLKRDSQKSELGVVDRGINGGE